MSRTSMLNVGDLIAEGLAQAGRSDLTTNAHTWLKLFLQKFYRTQDVDWLSKGSLAQAVSDGMAVPTDYRSARTMMLGTSDSKSEIPLSADRSEYLRRKNQYGSSSGQPVFAYTDNLNGKFYFVPSPSSGLYLDLEYYHEPDISGLADDDYLLWGLADQVIIDHIKQKAYEYSDDVRADTAQKEVMSGIAESKMNAHDMRAGSNKLKFGKSFRRGR